MNTCEFCYEDLLPPWPASFPQQLAIVAERQMLLPKGLSVCTYSTNNFLMHGSSNLVVQHVQPQAWHMRLETLSEPAAALFDNVGLKFPVQSGALASNATDAIRLVDVLLDQDLGIRASVESLVNAIHVIDSTGVGYDCSFSDPAIPFSVFVSLPGTAERNRSLRVFEAILHECMHLQLSCYELVEPMVQVGSNQSTWYSPWKKSRRKVLGILHGMYVFHVIAYMYNVLLDSAMLGDSDIQFVQQRLGDISVELNEVKGVEQSPDLTATGVKLAKAVLRSAFLHPRNHTAAI